jgi:hypothetical protein
MYCNTCSNPEGGDTQLMHLVYLYMKAPQGAEPPLDKSNAVLGLHMYSRNPVVKPCILWDIFLRSKE